jgi:hypothetical protein
LSLISPPSCASRSHPHLHPQTTHGRIINPITDSGRILAGPPGGAVLAGTTTWFPHNYGMRLAALPGAWKIASRALPDAFQDSAFVYGMFTRPLGVSPLWLGLGGGANGVPFVVVYTVLELIDVAATVLFLAAHNLQLVGSAAALALGVHAFKRAVRVTGSTVAAA